MNQSSPGGILILISLRTQQWESGGWVTCRLWDLYLCCSEIVEHTQEFLAMGWKHWRKAINSIYTVSSCSALCYFYSSCCCEFFSDKCGSLIWKSKFNKICLVKVSFLYERCGFFFSPKDGIPVCVVYYNLAGLMFRWKSRSKINLINSNNRNNRKQRLMCMSL